MIIIKWYVVIIPSINSSHYSSEYYHCKSLAGHQIMDPSTIVAVHDLASHKQDQRLVVTSKRSHMANLA